MKFSRVTHLDSFTASLFMLHIMCSLFISEFCIFYLEDGTIGGSAEVVIEDCKHEYHPSGHPFR